MFTKLHDLLVEIMVGAFDRIKDEVELWRGLIMEEGKIGYNPPPQSQYLPTRVPPAPPMPSFGPIYDADGMLCGFIPPPAPKPPAPKAKDWVCPSCGEVRKGELEKCPGCGKSRPQPSLSGAMANCGESILTAFISGLTESDWAEIMEAASAMKEERAVVDFGHIPVLVDAPTLPSVRPLCPSQESTNE